MSPTPKSKSKPTTIDEYLAAASDAQRAALEDLRRTIKAAVPKAEECIHYGVAAFRLDGKVVVGFGAAKEHCTFYPFTGHTVQDFKDDLKRFQTSKGAIQFQPEEPLPAAVVRKIIKSRIAETQIPHVARDAGPATRRKKE